MMEKFRHSYHRSRPYTDLPHPISRKPHSGFVPGGKRARVLIGVLGVVLLLLVGRLFFLQVIRGNYYSRISEENRIRFLTLPASRGEIKDRNGTNIASSRPSYTAFLIPYEVLEALPAKKSAREKRGLEFLVTKLADCLQLDTALLEQKVTSKWFKGYEPIKLKKDIDFNTVCVIEEQNEDLPGVIYQVEPTRKYLDAGWVGHLVGYVNEFGKKELSEGSAEKGFRLGGVTGRKGLEKQYDEMLRGKDGVTFLEVTALGKIMGPLQERNPDPPINGSDLWLTIDLDLQAVAESSLADYQSGAIAALDPRNGQILALVSKPGVNSNLFAGAMSPQEWNDILQDPLHPLLDRPLQATYPPGSTLKLLTAAIALETNTVSENTYFLSCNGSFQFGKRAFGCWQPGGHGRLNLHQAIVQSCDVYFYQMGLRVGLERWSRYAKMCGFGTKTGVDIPEEASGLVPSLEYYHKKYGRGDWVKNLVINLAIGQGEILVTPLQLAVFFAGLATDGRMMRPYVVDRIITQDGRVLSTQPEVIRYLPFSSSTLRVMQKAMEGVVQDPQGTGMASRIPGTTVAGKTGTAQNPHGEAHAWFVGYAPASDPKIVVVVLIENVGHGGTYAAPVAKAIMEKHLKKNSLIQDQFTAKQAGGG